MRDTRYRIKLYGHTCEDPELFRKNLAAMLAISEEESRELLLEVPAVIVEGAGKLRAETLVEALKSIQALCLAEMMEQTDEDEDSSAMDTTAGSESDDKGISVAKVLTDREPILEPELKEELKSHVWLGVTAAIGGTIVVACLVGYLLSYKNVSSKFGADARQAVGATEEAAPRAKAPQEDPSELIGFLTDEIERLKSGQEELEFRIGEQQQVATSLGAAGGKQWDRWREARARLAMLRHEHRENSNQIEEMERRLKRLRKKRKVQ